jgi:hypothetical protein
MTLADSIRQTASMAPWMSGAVTGAGRGRLALTADAHLAETFHRVAGSEVLESYHEPHGSVSSRLLLGGGLSGGGLRANPVLGLT